MLRTLALLGLANLASAAKTAEPFKFFLIPQTCWDGLWAGQLTFDCVVRTGVQGINLLNLIVAFYYRVPQIIKLLQTKSTVGLAWTSIVSDCLSLLCVIGYYFTLNYSIWNYGEVYINLAQLLIIYCLVYKYNGVTREQFAGSLVLIAGVFTAIMLRAFPPVVVGAFLGLSTALYLGSRFIQIRELLRTKYSKNLSLITLLISPAGIFSRLLTSIATLWHDKFLIVG